MIKEKLLYIGIGVITVLQITNTVLNRDSSKQIRVIQEKIAPIESEIKEIKKEVEIIKGAMYQSERVVTLSAKDKECLLRNIFFEAGVEDITGKIAVAQITMNRVKTSRWGASVCDVVHARKQFSWTLDSRKVASKPKGKLWEDSVKAKEMFVSGKRIKGLENSLHYHTDYIKQPKWAKSKTKVLKVGQHIFYNN